MRRLAEYDSLSPRVRLFLWLVDRVGAVLALPFRAWRALFGDRAGPIRRILLLRCDGIGDLVLSTPAIRAIRRRFPAATIHLVIAPWASGLAELIPDVDRVFIHASWGYRRLRGRRDGLAEDWRFARWARRQRYDLAVDLRGDLLSILPLTFWGVPLRYGRDSRGGAFALTHVIPPPAPDRRHEIDRTLDVAAALGATGQDEATLTPPAPAVEAARRAFADRGLDPARTILLAPGAQWRWRRWPEFGDLAARLAGEGWRVAVVGAAGDQPLYAEIAASSPEAVSLIGAFDLSSLTAAFGLAGGFVAVESGPAHLAAAGNGRGVVLFGPGIPADFGPRAAAVRVVARACPLHPCYQQGDCANPSAWCMDRIGVDEVYAALMDAAR